LQFVRIIKSKNDRRRFVASCKILGISGIYASSCVAFAVCRGDGHRILVTRFGVSIMKGF